MDVALPLADPARMLPVPGAGARTDIGTDAGSGVVPMTLDTQAEVLDAVAQVEAMIRTLTAWRTELLDQAGRLARVAVRASIPAGAPAALRADRERMAHRGMVADVATVVGLSERAAAELVEEAGTLVHELPATLSAMRAGRVSYRNARVLVEHTADLDAPARAAVERAVLPRATSSTTAGLRRVARRARERLHPEPTTVRHAREAERRAVHLEPGTDGMSWFSAYVPAVAAHAMFDRVDAAARTLDAPGEDRTLAQRRADVLADLVLDDASAAVLAAFTRAGKDEGATARTRSSELPAGAGRHDRTPGPDEAARTRDRGPGGDDANGTDNHTRASNGIRASDGTGTGRGTASDDGNGGVRGWLRGIRPTVVVTVPVLTLLGHGDEPGELEGHGPIDAATARELAANAPSFLRVLTHPHTGVVLGVSRDRYAVPADLRAALRIRDATCRFAGCGRAARHCDVDHTVAWTDGGGTDLENLAHLCRHHHRIKHETGWTVRSLGGGELRWTSPTGRTTVTEPAVRLPAATTSTPLAGATRSPGRTGAARQRDPAPRHAPDPPPLPGAEAIDPPPF